MQIIRTNSFILDGALWLRAFGLPLVQISSSQIPNLKTQKVTVVLRCLTGESIPTEKKGVHWIEFIRGFFFGAKYRNLRETIESFFR